MASTDMVRHRAGQLSGDREARRLLMIDRDNAVQSYKTGRTVLTAPLASMCRCLALVR